MKAKTDPTYNEMASFFKALAHPTRVYLLDLLALRDYCVCELTELVGADISTVSKHLSLLKQAKILIDFKEGNKVYYRLHYPCVQEIIGCVANRNTALVNAQNKAPSICQ